MVFHLSRIKLGSVGSLLFPGLFRLTSSIKPDSLIPSRIARLVIQYSSQKKPASINISKTMLPNTSRPICISMASSLLISGV